MGMTLKLTFRPSTVPGREGYLVWRFIKDRQVCNLASGCTCHKDEFDEKTQQFRYGGLTEERQEFLRSEEQTLAAAKKTIELIIKARAKRDGDYNIDEVLAFYKDNRQRFFFLDFIDEQARRAGKLMQTSKKEHYTSTYNKFAKFTGGKDMLISDLTADTMAEFNAMMKADGLQTNTLSFYNRILRAVYNIAIEQGLTEDRNPFRHVYTGIAKTAKRAIPVSVIRKIAHLDLQDNTPDDYARDMFLFSFYTRGMSFVDMAFLKKSNLQNGILTYRRRKTGQALNIKWEKPMQDILDKHKADDGSPYLLDIIRPDGSSDERSQYKSRSFTVNFHLKDVGRAVGLQVPLTMYVARHSWASACKASNIPLSVISEGMGHDNEETTRIYLAQLDTSVVDKANRKIIKQVI